MMQEPQLSEKGVRPAENPARLRRTVSKQSSEVTTELSAAAIPISSMDMSP